MGCLFWLAAAAVIAAVVGVIGYRATRTPDFGPPPGGSVDGVTEHDIAATLAPRLARGLVQSRHPVLLLSERDLTVLAAARNPVAARLHNPLARIRDGRVVITGESAVVGVPVVTVARLGVSLGQVGTVNSHVVAQLDQLSVGDLDVPDWARARVAPQAPSTININDLFGNNPTLRALSPYLDCVAPASDGLRLGFHRPGMAADPAGCAATVPVQG